MLKKARYFYRLATWQIYEELFFDKFSHLNINTTTLNKSLKATGRLDAEYYQSKFDEIEKLIKNYKGGYAFLGDIVSMNKSIEPGSDKYKDSGVPFVRVGNLNKFEISKSDIFLDADEFATALRPSKDDILLSKDGSVGIAYCMSENADFITSSAILHLKINNDEFLPQVLSLILNSVLVKLQAERDSGGSIIEHWKVSEIKNVIIPKINKTMQDKIAAKITQSFELRKESKNLLELAKNMVEEKIVQKA